jgi:excisionase family DNA binding protein
MGESSPTTGIADASTNAGTRLLDVKEAAAFLNVSTRTLWSMANSGELPSVRIRRRVLFDLRDLEAFIEAAKSTKKGARP